MGVITTIYLGKKTPMETPMSHGSLQDVIEGRDVETTEISWPSHGELPSESTRSLPLRMPQHCEARVARCLKVRGKRWDGLESF